jgi:hypothetical protein
VPEHTPRGSPCAHEPESPPAASAITIAVFAALLLWPAALALAGRAGADADFIYHSEMRRPFVAPPVTSGALATGGWERDAEREIADAFPLRRTLIEAYDGAKFRWLDDVASVHVTRGSGGWMFFADEERAYDDGTFAPSDAELERIAGLYAGRARWCQARGTAYVFLIVPNKSTVYARFLPAWAKHVEPNAAERLVPLLRARGVRVLYPRDALRDASYRGDVYQRDDTHWNDAGAYTAYREVLAALGPAIGHDAIDPRTIRAHDEPAVGDLDRFAGIGAWHRSTTVRYDFPERAHAAAPPDYPGDATAAEYQRTADAVDDPSARGAVMLFGDSFSIALRRFVAEDFHRTVVMQHEITSVHHFDRAAVAAEKPAVVIQELVERALMNADRFAP